MIFYFCERHLNLNQAWTSKMQLTLNVNRALQICYPVVPTLKGCCKENALGTEKGVAINFILSTSDSQELYKLFFAALTNLL